MSKPNILHVSSNVFPPLSADHSTKKIWLELAKPANSYHIFARSSKHRFEYFVEGKLHLHLVPNLFTAKSFFFTSFLSRRIIKRHSIDIAVVQCPVLGGYAINKMSKKLNISVFQEVHDTIYFDAKYKKGLYSRLLFYFFKYSINKAERIRALNSVMRKKLIKLTKKEIVIIENRVNLKIFKPKKNYDLHEPIKIVSVGSLTKRKGYHHAINAVKALNSDFEIELTIIGEGEDKKYFQELSSGYSNIQFAGYLNQNKINEILSESDIYIQPSLREGMPRAILEAMAVKLPVIATNLSLISGTIIDDYNGKLIQPDDYVDLKRKIIEIIENEKLRLSIIENAYERILKYHDWENNFDIFRKEIYSL